MKCHEVDYEIFGDEPGTPWDMTICRPGFWDLIFMTGKAGCFYPAVDEIICSGK